MSRTSRPGSRRCNISEARAKLPELARFLANHPDQVVLVEHRDLTETLALITESHLRYLETTVAELKRRSNHPFLLSASMESRLSDDELDTAIGQMRSEMSKGAAEAMAEIGQ